MNVFLMKKFECKCCLRCWFGCEGVKEVVKSWEIDEDDLDNVFDKKKKVEKDFWCLDGCGKVKYWIYFFFGDRESNLFVFFFCCVLLGEYEEICC